MFTEWFKLDPLQNFHKVILAEDFMEYLAPTYWPPQERIGFCWKPENDEDNDCHMTEGRQLKLFWVTLVFSQFFTFLS